MQAVSVCPGVPEGVVGGGVAGGGGAGRGCGDFPHVAETTIIRFGKFLMPPTGKWLLFVISTRHKR